MESLERKVAWVAGVGEGGTDRVREVGRCVALLLAAGGSRVLVSGGDERVLGACVGEIAHGGGSARHKVGQLGTADEARAIAEAAVERFGGLDVAVVVGGSLAQMAHGVEAARASLRPSGRVVVVSEYGASGTELRAYVGEVGAVITCTAVLLGGLEGELPAVEPESVAEVVVSLCRLDGDAVSGSTVTLA